MLRLNNTTNCPPGGIKYFVKETGTWIGPHLSIFDSRNAVEAHYKANGFRVPNELESVIQDQLCQNMPAGWCIDAHGREHGKSWIGQLWNDVQTIMAGTNTLARWKLSGEPLVPLEEANRRGGICLSCPKHAPVSGCNACNSTALANLVSDIVGNQRSQHHDALQACAACHCLLKPKVWLPKKHLLASMSEDQKDALSEQCWLREP